jgi:hypothetical protein
MIVEDLRTIAIEITEPSPKPRADVGPVETVFERRLRNEAIGLSVAMGLALSALLAPGANAQKQPTKADADGRAEQLDHCKFFPKAAASHWKLAAA